MVAAGCDGDVVLRRAGSADALPAAEVWLRSYRTVGVQCAHSPAEVRDWFVRVLVPQRETWVAVAGGGAVVGVMVLHGDDLKQLYLDPPWRGRGLGDRFVALAKQQRPQGLSCWAFQVNGAACRFYRRHGFVAVQWTDGQTNDEREPDVRFVWKPGRCG